MIRRDILSNPDSVLADFDWFNDYKDTRQFVSGFGLARASLLARLDNGYAAWLKVDTKQVDAIEFSHPALDKPLLVTKGNFEITPPKSRTLAQRCLELPGMTRRRVPGLAHEADQLEESIAARMRRYFEARAKLEAGLCQQYTQNAVYMAGAAVPRNPRELLAWLATEIRHDVPASALLEELATTLAPFLSQLPEP